MAEFKIGDTVRLKSGGPAMTVTAISDISGDPVVWCYWFPGENKKVEDHFPPESLESA